MEFQTPTYSTAPAWDWVVRLAVTIAVAATSPFLLTLLITSWNAHHAIAVASKASSPLKRPPTLPYAVPILGHVFQFMWDGNKLMSNAAKHVARSVPTQIIIPIFPNYVVSGPEQVLAYFRDSRELSTTTRSIKVMENAFGCPSHLVDQFLPTKIAPNTPPELNIEYLIHSALKSGLSGPFLDTLTARYQHYLIEQIAKDKSIGDEWQELPDLNAWVEKHVYEAATRSMFGTYMLDLNPNIAHDFWTFNKNIGALFMGQPRWMNRAAHEARGRMLANIQRWQKHAAENADLDDFRDVEWEPYYGSKFIRERQGLLTKRGIVDERARAAENFAFMWATNSNSVPAATWLLYETLHDPSLKARVKAILPDMSQENQHADDTSLTPFDVPQLSESTLLQSMYAETLRLRVAVLVVRQPSKDNYSFCGWHIKKDEVLSISTRSEAMNDEMWSTRGGHPLDEFWSDRFILDTEDPDSGPLRKQRQKNVTSAAKGKRFSMDGLSASWIPYGGGSSLCPGRHFAKREIIATTALLLTAYDLELVDGKDKKKADVDMSCFGFGTMPPNRNIPFRIRRRKV